MAREYRGWTIAVHSFEAEMGKWRPVVTVSLEARRAEILTRRLLTPLGKVHQRAGRGPTSAFLL